MNKATQSFIDSITDVKFFKPQMAPKSEWRLFIKSTWGATYSAARNAARDAACNAARSATYSAAYSAARSATYSAAYDAARSAAFDAARSAAYNAAYSAAHSAAFNAAYSAARSAFYDAFYDAAHDAALVAVCLLMAGKIESKHLQHVLMRWEAWKMGYGVVIDVDGALYVYAAMNGIERAVKKATSK